MLKLILLICNIICLTFGRIEHDIETDYGFYQFKINSLDDLDNSEEKLTNA